MGRSRSISLIGAALSLSAALVAPGYAAADAALDTARERWRAAGLTTYEYGYHKFCECHRESPPETIVSVDGERVTRVRHRPPNSTVEVPAEDRNLEYYWTVDGLFALLQTAFDRGVVVRAEYDATLGFPRSLFIDYDADFIGDELDLRLTMVTPL